MKKIIFAITVLSVAVLLKSCQKSTVVKTNTQEQTATTTVKDGRTITDTTKVASATVEGKVIKIETGKDGYTAAIVTKDNQQYFVTISHANMTYHEDYRRVKVGEVITVTGEIWKSDDKTYITVHEMNEKK